MRVEKGLEMEPKKTINNDVVALLLKLTPAHIKPKSSESRRNLFLSFLPGVDAPHV